MIAVYHMILSLFDARERRSFWLLTLLMVLVAIAEVIGISMVLVLLKVLATPEAITESDMLSWAYVALGFSNTFSFQLSLAVGVFAVVLGSLVVKAIGSYAIIRFSEMRYYTISSRLLSSYMSRPYAWFLEHNSAEMGKNVLQEVSKLVSQLIVPGLRLLSNIMVATGIVGFLIFLEPLISVLTAIFLGGSYAFIYALLRERLRNSGEEMRMMFGQQYQIASEATGGIKELKLLGLERAYADRYASVARRTANLQSQVRLMGEMPRFALEAITFGTLLVLVMVLLARSGGDISSTIPILGVFAFSVMRLLPALQQTYHGFASMRSGIAMLNGIVADFHQVSGIGDSSVEALRLDRSLELTGVTFRYASARCPTLEGLDLKIQARTTVGLVGATGAGKTTLIDLILGLLTPDAGEIRTDGKEVTASNLRAWQKSLGYVPQTIYLTDDSVAANIAFGVPPHEVDPVAVERAARAAALHDFVTTEMPRGYDTMVGERGVRLSGGQRQRIGIARALYRNPSLLIMDEATSALDNITERAVMEAVQNIRADTTIILIAHRLSTVKDCDRIYLMEKGRIVAEGTYEELVVENAAFRNLAQGADQ